MINTAALSFGFEASFMGFKMLTANAVKLLAKYTKLTRRGTDYRATVAETGATISFVDADGRVARLRLQRPGARTWACRSLTAALRHALSRGKVVPAPPLLLSVYIDRRGPSFNPAASFMVMDLGEGPTHLDGGAAEWADGEARDVAYGVIEGRVSADNLIGWLKRRGGDVGRVVTARRRTHSPTAPA